MMVCLVCGGEPKRVGKAHAQCGCARFTYTRLSRLDNPGAHLGAWTFGLARSVNEVRKSVFERNHRAQIHRSWTLRLESWHAGPGTLCVRADGSEVPAYHDLGKPDETSAGDVERVLAEFIVRDVITA